MVGRGPAGAMTPQDFVDMIGQLQQMGAQPVTMLEPGAPPDPGLRLLPQEGQSRRPQVPTSATIGPSGLNPELAREALASVFAMVEESEYEHEQNATRVAQVCRDGLIALGYDPSDRHVLEGAFAGCWMVMNHLVGNLPPHPVTVYAAYITEVFRRWIDGEAAIYSVADLAGLAGLDDDLDVGEGE